MLRKCLRLHKFLWECNLWALLSESFTVGEGHIYTEDVSVLLTFITECNLLGCSNDAI